MATFRSEMEDRLHAARDGRQRAFADFNHRKERALGLTPTLTLTLTLTLNLTRTP